MGKSNVVVNLGLALAQRGLRVLLIDADLGLGNLDILLGLTPQLTLQDALAAQLKLSEVIVEGPGGLKILPASSGIAEIAVLDEFQKLFLLNEMDHYTEDMDVVLIDTGAGISPNVLFFQSRAQERILVVNNQPPAIADAYALIKILVSQHGETSFKLLVNGLTNPRRRNWSIAPCSGWPTVSWTGRSLWITWVYTLRPNLAQSGNETAAGPGPLSPVSGQPVFCHDCANSVENQAPACP